MNITGHLFASVQFSGCY